MNKKKNKIKSSSIGIFLFRKFPKKPSKTIQNTKKKIIETSWNGRSEKKIENNKPTDKSISGKLIKDFQLLKKLRVMEI
jgi:hypothetical protein